MSKSPREHHDQIERNALDLIDDLAAERKETARILRDTAMEIRTGKIRPPHVANRLAKRAREIDPEGEGK